MFRQVCYSCADPEFIKMPLNKATFWAIFEKANHLSY